LPLSLNALVVVEEVALILIQIIGAPIAWKDGVKDSWRETVEWAAKQIKARYGDTVCMEYFDLFDPGCPPLPEGVQ